LRDAQQFGSCNQVYIAYTCVHRTKLGRESKQTCAYVHIIELPCLQYRRKCSQLEAAEGARSRKNGNRNIA